MENGLLVEMGHILFAAMAAAAAAAAVTSSVSTLAGKSSIATGVFSWFSQSL
jgi:hypothetical protein